MKKLVIIAGERPAHKENSCNSNSGFFEAILLSKNLPMKRNNRLIPIGQSPYPIYIHEKKSNLINTEMSLELFEEGRNLTEEEAYEIFSNFTFMEDHKVSYLLLNDKRKIRQRKKKKLRQLHEEIKI